MVDNDNLMDDGTGRAPHQEQKAAIYQRVANDTVVVGYPMALKVGGRPPGKRVIVLSDESPTYRYPCLCKVYAERWLPDLWRGAEVAHSVLEVFARCKGERAIYVLGGQSALLAFQPYASVVHKFVPNGDSIPSAQTMGTRAYFSTLPGAPSSVETPSDQYRIETYESTPTLTVPSFDAIDVLMRGDGPCPHVPAAASKVWAFAPTHSALPHMSQFLYDASVPLASCATTGMPTQASSPCGFPLPPLYAQQAHVYGSENEALEKALQESIKNAPPVEENGDALGDTDYWQFLIQEFDRVQRQKAGTSGRRPRSKKDDIKGKAKLSDDDDDDDGDDALSESRPKEEPVTARGLVIHSFESAHDKGDPKEGAFDAEPLDDEQEAVTEDQDFLIDSDVEYDPDDYGDDDGSFQEDDQQGGASQCST